MKRTTRPTGSDLQNTLDTRPATKTANRETLLSRMQLAFLDQYTREKPGYDPYDTATHRATPDIWMAKRKRA